MPARQSYPINPVLASGRIVPRNPTMRMRCLGVDRAVGSGDRDAGGRPGAVIDSDLDPGARVAVD